MENIQIQQISLRDAFRDKRTGRLIPFTAQSRSLYEKKPDRYILPMNFNWIGGEWKPNLSGREMNIRFVRVRKNRTFIISATDQVRDKTYRYTSQENLDSQIQETLEEWNEDYDPNQRWTTDGEQDDAQEWFVEMSLSLILRSDRHGYSGNTATIFTQFAPSGMYEDFNTQAVALPISMGASLPSLNFNGNPINYKLPFLRKEDDEFDSRCCWRFLSKYHKIPVKKLMEITGKRYNEDVWSFDELLAVAKERKLILEVFDIQGDPYRTFSLEDNEVKWEEPYRYFPPHDVKARPRGLAFMTIGGHIYPYHPHYQRRLLLAVSHGAKSFRGITSKGEVMDDEVGKMSQLFIDTLPQGKKRQSLQEKYDEQVEDALNTKVWEKGQFRIGEAKHNFYKDAILDDVVRDLYYTSNEIYPFTTDRNGNINCVWESDYDPETGESILLWKLTATPNIDVVKPVFDKLTLIYRGQDIKALGRLIYTNVIGGEWGKLQSQTCGSIFETEMPFNYTTEVLRTHSETNSYPKEVADWEQAERITDILREAFLREERQAKHILSQQPDFEADDVLVQKSIDEYVDTHYPSTPKPEPHGEQFCEEFGRVLCLDFNKFYSSRLEEPHNEFMKFENFDNVEVFTQPKAGLKNGFYYCLIPDALEPHEFIPFADKTAGWFCKSVVTYAFEVLPADKRPTITHQLIPHSKNIIKRETFKAFVDFVYKEMPDEAKTIVNHFVGTLGMNSKERVVENPILVRDRNDIEYQRLKGHSIKHFAEEREEKGELFMSFTSRMTDRRETALPIHIQILQEAKVELEVLRRKLKFGKTQTIQKVIEGDKPSSFGMWKASILSNKWTRLWGFEPLKLEEGYRKYVKSLCKVETSTTFEEYGKPILFKTDCIVIADFGSGNLDKVIADVEIGEERGQLKVEWDTQALPDREKLKHLSKANFILRKTETKLTETNSHHETKYKRNDVYRLIDDRKSFRVNGKAGTGKSGLCIGGHEKGIIPYLQEEDLKFAICATTHKASHNRLFEEVGVSGQTIDSLLGIRPNAPPKDKTFSQLADLDYIIIDECSMLQKTFYCYLKQVKLFHPHTNLILVGDYNQLPPVEKGRNFTSYDYEQANVLKWLCDYNLVELTENMRSSKEGVEMFEWYNQLIKGGNHKKGCGIPSMELTWFIKNLCYTNASVGFVNYWVMENLKKAYPIPNLILKPCKVKGKTTKPKNLIHGIWIGDRDTYPMCEIRSNQTDQEGQYYNNQEFCITAQFPEEYELECRVTQKKVVVSVVKLYKDFTYNYATTIHKSQGDTIDQDYNVWEWDEMGQSHQGNALRYVAVSRTTEKKNIHIINTPQGFPHSLTEYDKYLTATKTNK